MGGKGWPHAAPQTATNRQPARQTCRAHWRKGSPAGVRGAINSQPAHGFLNIVVSTHPEARVAQVGGVTVVPGVGLRALGAFRAEAGRGAAAVASPPGAAAAAAAATAAPGAAGSARGRGRRGRRPHGRPSRRRRRAEGTKHRVSAESGRRRYAYSQVGLTACQSRGRPRGWCAPAGRPGWPAPGPQPGAWPASPASPGGPFCFRGPCPRGGSCRSCHSHGPGGPALKHNTQTCCALRNGGSAEVAANCANEPGGGTARRPRTPPGSRGGRAGQHNQREETKIQKRQPEIRTRRLKSEGLTCFRIGLQRRRYVCQTAS